MHLVHARRSAIAAALALLPLAARAGPPYVTDDPEPVEHRHWELYLATLDAHDASGWTGTAPHVEVNYGVVPDVQLHAIVPLAWARPPFGPARYGVGDVELGAKIRFVHESEHVPMVGTFPLLELPAGDAARGLGAGVVQLFLPLWLQKSAGPWLTYGGAGYWIHPGSGHRNWWYLGWHAERRFGPASIGAEIFHTTPREEGGGSETRWDVGLVLDASPVHHLLFSAGTRFDDVAAFQGYAAWLVTLPGA